jgi:hypothetical protein
MSSAKNSFAYLQEKGCGGTSLVDPESSCLTWFGGDMPQGGPSSYPQAVTDMDAWVAAGALDN